MNRDELYDLCGLPQELSTKTEPNWITAKLRFIGAEHYVLGTKFADVVVRQMQGGVSLLFRTPQQLPASALLGKSKAPGILLDVEIVMGPVTMSLAKIGPVKYPLVLRNEEVVNLL